MGLDSKLIHGLVKQARGILLGMAATVIHKTKVSQDGYGKIKWSDGVPLQAFISKKQRKIVMTDGREVVSGFQVLIPESVLIGVNDRIVMPDGSTPPILQVQAPLDDTGQAYVTEVFF
jgi:hypothetical protein